MKILKTQPPPGTVIVAVAKGKRTCGKHARCFVWTVPLRLVSEANQSEHWATKMRRKKAQQSAIALTFPPWARGVMKGKGWPKCVVLLIRQGPRAMDPDNNAGSFKHVQDAIAAQLGIDDGDSRIAWTYEQAKGDYAVTVQVERVD